MKIHPQIISEGKLPVFVVLPYKEYESLLNLLEDFTDIQIMNTVSKDKSERFPIDLIEQIAAGANAIKTFREYRNLSQTALAKKVKITRQYISQLESGEKSGSPKILKMIAKALMVDVDDLI
jgi:DNA-binding XRE family transcriptional regulator